MIQINNTCLSVKKKNSTEQCPYKRKGTHLFCGIHLRSKNVVRVDELPELYDVANYIGQINMKCEVVKDTKPKKKKQIKTKDKVELNTVKDEKKQFYRKLVIDALIKIQSVLRMYDIKRRMKSTNKESCFTLESIYEIPTIYTYMCYQKDIDKYYCFDIRNLKKMIQIKNLNNPYTNTKFSEKEIQKINNKIKNLDDIFYSTELVKEKITKKQDLNSYVLNTFHKIDLLGNYTDMNWFMNLNLNQLHRLYYESYDMFYYRIPLTLNERKLYVKDGIVFLTSYTDIKKIKSINKLRIIIMDEYNKFLDFDTDESNKKTSCIWLLMALMEVSNPARDALQHLLV